MRRETMRFARVLWATAMIAACSSSPLQVDGSAATDGGSRRDAGVVSDGGVATDGGVASDGGRGSGAECTFNADCPSSERCECDEATGCFCFAGVRGTGRNGVAPCVTSNDCETALCVEGDGGFYCSGPCTGPGDCGPRLPRCSNIAFIGRICIR